MNLYQQIQERSFRLDPPVRLAYVAPLAREGGKYIYPPAGTLNIVLSGTLEQLYGVPFLVDSPNKSLTPDYPSEGTKCLVAIIRNSAFILGFVGKTYEWNREITPKSPESVSRIGNTVVSQTISSVDITIASEESASTGISVTREVTDMSGKRLSKVFEKSSSVCSEQSMVVDSLGATVKSLALEVKELTAQVQSMRVLLDKLTVEAEKGISVKSKGEVFIDAPMVKIENASLINIGGPTNQPAVLSRNLITFLSKVLSMIAGGIGSVNPTAGANIAAAIPELSSILSTKVNVAE